MDNSTGPVPVAQGRWPDSIEERLRDEAKRLKRSMDREGRPPKPPRQKHHKKHHKHNKKQRKNQKWQHRREKPPKPPGPCPYNLYLQSDWWRWIRRKKMQRASYRCERCGERATQVHHKTYERLGKEWLSDLEAICAKCHGMQHEALKQADSHLRSIANE